MNQRSQRQNPNPLIRGITFGVLGFILGLVVSLPSRHATEYLNIYAAIFVLIIIVSFGVLSDMIGVAAAAGREEPFNAMASRRITGARHALDLVRNADRVSAVCADVIGDIAGTVSGAAAAAVVLRLAATAPEILADATLADGIVVALVAGLTVGGKAACKIFALNSSTRILLVVGKVLWWLDNYLNIRFFGTADRRRRRGS